MADSGELRCPVKLEEGWSRMRAGLDKLRRIMEGEPDTNFSASEYMHLYTTIYNMCTQKAPNDHSEPLYERYKQAFTDYIQEKVLPALGEHQGEFILKELHRRWENHTLMVRWLSKFFHYLDRYYIPRHGLESLKDVGLLCFRELVYTAVKVKARTSILEMIQQEREGEVIDRHLVKGILSIFIKVGQEQMDCYQRDFEEPMLQDTSRYYQRKAAAWVVDDSTPEYLIKAEKRLLKEEERVDNYIDNSSREKLLAVCRKELLETYETQLLEKENSGCAALLRDDKREDLARMYRLFSKVERGLDPMAAIFKVHVESQGMRLVKEVTEAAENRSTGVKPVPVDQQFVQQLIQLHDKYLQYVMDCFNNSNLFHKALKEAFEVFCNKNIGPASSAELMASFCDSLLKKGGTEKPSDEVIEELLDKVVKLLGFISDKDLFAEFYRKKLAKRLLFEKSASDDHERSILTRLKQQCGAQFTTKMEGMVTDLALAKEKQQEFEAWQQQEDRTTKSDLNVTVLTTGFWPTYKNTDLTLPEEMVHGVALFKEFYESITKHRRLCWIYTLGTCHVKGSFDTRPIELIVAPFQAVVLMLFNNLEQDLSHEEIQQRTNIPDEDLSRVLHSLSCAKYKILLKDPEGKTIAKTDRFRVNPKFTDKMRRVRVPLPPVDDRKKVTEDVDKDRRHAIDAAIVRTMKSRKVLQHQQLVLEVVQQLSRMCKPDFKLIKKRIEDLISRDYLERDRENANLYRYLA